jgi:hypothetical protein
MCIESGKIPDQACKPLQKKVIVWAPVKKLITLLWNDKKIYKWSEWWKGQMYKCSWGFIETIDMIYGMIEQKNSNLGLN